MNDAPSKRHAMPLVRIELVLQSLVDGRLSVLLARRQAAPWKGRWALPGGALRIDLDRSLEDAARRVASERLNAGLACLQQLRAVGGPSRDPRAPWALSVVYRGLLRVEALEVAPGKRIEALRWWAVDEVDDAARPAFDHGELVRSAAQVLRQQVDRLELPFEFLPEKFTLSELQGDCERMLGRRLDKSSFRRRLDERNLVEPLPGEMRTGANRPAQLYRARSVKD